MYESKNINNNEAVIARFNKHFQVISVDRFEEADYFIQLHEIKVLYIIKSGQYDNKLSKIAKNIVHCVFECNEPHGEVYCSVSKYVAGNNGRFPVLPHIVSMPAHEESMREALGIPKNALVFGRHGGYYQFDIYYAQAAVYTVARYNPNIYFLFVNTCQFCPPLKNIVHLPPMVDPVDKRRFINTCDAMIWARSDGETFGLAIAEFVICNKPVIATKTNVKDSAHSNMLGNYAIWYSNQLDLIHILNNYSRSECTRSDYTLCTPQNIMKVFNGLMNQALLSFPIKQHLLSLSKQNSIPISHTNFLHKLKYEYNFEPRVCYDIGCCVVNWTHVAESIWPRTKCILFDAFEDAEFLYAAYDYHVGVLSDIDHKEIRFYQNSYHPTGNSYYQERDHPELFSSDKSILKHAMTLDSVVAQRGFEYPDLIKIDTQGSELDILKGAQNTLKRAKVLIVEMQHTDYNLGAPKVSETKPYIESLGWECIAERFSDNGADADYCFWRKLDRGCAN